VFLMIASTSSCGISSTTSAIAIAAFKTGQECTHSASTSRRGRGMGRSQGGGANEGKKTTQASSAAVHKSFAAQMAAQSAVLRMGVGPMRASNCGHQSTSEPCCLLTWRQPGAPRVTALTRMPSCRGVI
jgi:hypothetical protein